MHRERRAKQRIDYQVYHRKGEKVIKVNTQENYVVSRDEKDTMPEHDKPDGISIRSSEEKDRMALQISALGDDIEDFIDENPADDIRDSLTDLDFVINRAEEYRSLYRSKFKELANYGGEDDTVRYEEKMTSIKNYILESKKRRREIKDHERNGLEMEKQSKNQAFLFVFNDVSRLMSELEVEFTVTDTTLAKESELIRRGKELSEIEKKMKNISEKFPVMLSYTVSGKEFDEKVKKVEDRYGCMVTSKDECVRRVKKLIEDKELEKEDVFKIAKLNVKLPKFKGYDSTHDIFTFQSAFEKLHLRSTPRRMLPDMLKNNFLDGTALALVEGLDNIDEIWSRLKTAFGDPKIMLNRKFEEITKIGAISGGKDPEKTIDALQKLVNLMNDLTKLSKEHKIENDLYHGDGLERICKAIGDRRVTRWLSETCNAELSNKESWESVLKFLEKESKIQQQKMILLGSTKDRNTKDSKYDRSKKGQSAHYAGDFHAPSDARSTADIVCSICNETGHIATMGPNYSKIVQYFSCKKFVDMTPAERFVAVKSKGFCFQCLLPGADAGKGKHNEGKCQRNFACRHQSHSRYRKKKHVLLCEEHKNTTENQELLDEYKRKCILKETMADLPSYSKEIKLTFHADKYISTNACSPVIGKDEVTDNAIYQLQRIKVDGQC